MGGRYQRALQIDSPVTPFDLQSGKDELLTLNDVDGEGPGHLLHSPHSGGADVVSVEAGVEAVDEDAPVGEGREVHAWGQSGAIVHAEAHVSGCRVGQQAGQQALLPLLPHHSEVGDAGPEQAVWICREIRLGKELSLGGR